jgi:hypothetical protein
MPCSGVRKKTCVSNDTECKWVVRKGCRRLVPTATSAVKKKEPLKKTTSKKLSLPTSTKSIKTNKAPKKTPVQVTVAKATTVKSASPRRSRLEWVAADYAIIQTGYTSRIPRIMGGAQKMASEFKTYSSGIGEIVAIRDTYAGAHDAPWSTFGIADENAKMIYRFLKKNDIDGCVVIKVKRDVLQVMLAFATLFELQGKYSYCSAFNGIPGSMQIGVSGSLGKVVVAYYDADSG